MGGFHTTVHAAQAADGPAYSNLSRYYVYDSSEWTGWRCGDNGIIGSINFEVSWDNPDHYPYLFRVDGELAGLAMVLRSNMDGDAPLYNVGHFFVLRKFRRKGIGKAAAFSLFDNFRGRWEVRQLLENPSAQRFWQTVSSEYTDENYTTANEYVESAECEMVVQRFANTV